jgi:hypothetical protein
MDIGGLLEMLKKFIVVAARVDLPDTGPLNVVCVPWVHFSHPMGADIYRRLINKAPYQAVCVSKSPEGEWQCDPLLEGIWLIICDTTIPEKLDWRAMEIESEEVPGEVMESMIEGERGSV